MDQVPYPLGESRAVPGEGDDRDFHIRELRARRERDDTAVEPVEAVALDLVRTIAVTADVVAQAHLPRMQTQACERVLHGGPYAVVAAAVTPRASSFGVIFGNGDRANPHCSLH